MLTIQDLFILIFIFALFMSGAFLALLKLKLWQYLGIQKPCEFCISFWIAIAISLFFFNPLVSFGIALSAAALTHYICMRLLL